MLARRAWPAYAGPMNLLREREKNRLLRRETDAAAARRKLRDALGAIPGLDRVVIFGSLARRGAFHSRSDIDVAIEKEPPGMTRYQLAARLEEAMGRPVDVVLLGETRLRDKILCEGETWTL